MAGWTLKVRATSRTDFPSLSSRWARFRWAAFIFWVFRSGRLALDGLWLKRSWGGEVKNVSVLVAIGMAQSGYRQILTVTEGAKEDKASWTEFLRGLKERGSAG